MENTLFEAPEYPILAKFKTCVILFVKQAIILLLMLLLIRIAEIGFYYFSKQVHGNSISLMADGMLSSFIYFLKSLPILFIPYVVIFFSNMRGLALKIMNYILFALYLLVELLLAKYFFETKMLLGETLPLGQHIELTKWFSLNYYWFGGVILVLVLLWFLLETARKLVFIETISAFVIVTVGLLMLFFGVSSLPEEEKSVLFRVKVSKSAYLLEKTCAFYFEEEPEVDIYKENYID